jgi:membrane protein implicated in regulation of membrane protease activity
VFFLLALVLLLVLPYPWNLVGCLVSLVLAGGEVTFWNRRVKRRRAGVGAETLIGRSATVLSACRPYGQVRVAGEIWEARCDAGASAGVTVTIVGREALTLIVEPRS